MQHNRNETIKTVIIFGKEYKLCNPSLHSYNFLQPRFTSSAYVEILSSPLCICTHSLCTSFGVKDKVSGTQETKGEIIVLYILISECLDSKRLEDSPQYLTVKHYCTYLVTPEGIVYSRHVNCQQAQCNTKQVE